MEDWKSLDWVKAHGKTIVEETKKNVIISVGLEVKLLGDKPFYQARVSNIDTVIITKTSNSCAFNAKFTWEGITYFLNVPYWDYYGDLRKINTNYRRSDTPRFRPFFWIECGRMQKRFLSSTVHHLKYSE